jgi:hypothetical protein
MTAVLVGLIIVQHKLDLRSKNASLRSAMKTEGMQISQTSQIYAYIHT